MRRRDILLKAGFLTGGALAAELLPRVARFARAAGVERADCEIFPPDGARDFKVLHRDRVAGRHRIAFSRAAAGHADRFVVRGDIEIEARLSGGDVYRFAQHTEEVWRDGWLDALVSDTDAEARLYRVRAERRGGIFAGAVNGAAFTVSGYIVPSSLWHHDTIAAEALLDTVDGRVKIVRSRALGEETVPVAGAPVLAQRYALYGEIARELWYDAHCRLVRAELPLRDGSWLTLEPR